MQRLIIIYINTCTYIANHLSIATVDISNQTCISKTLNKLHSTYIILCITTHKIISIITYQDTQLCVVQPSSGAARHCVLFTRTNFKPFITQKLLGLFYQNHVHRCPTVSLSCVTNLKGISPAVPEIFGSKRHPNFFVFFFFATLINLFKNNLPLLWIPPNLHHQ